MHFSYQAVVLAAIAFEGVLAQPAHRHVHQHKQRDLADVLGKRQDWNAPGTYINPVTGKEFTSAEWQCLVAKNGDHSCFTVDGGSPASGGSPPASSPAVSAAPAIQNKHAVNPSPPATSTSPDTPTGSQSDGGPGAHVFNKASKTQTFIFYQNTPEDAGQASNPGITITVGPNSDKFVSLPTTWKGHVQRAPADTSVISPATWVEIQVKASDGSAWGDVSLQKGCDGAAMIRSPTNGKAFGFTEDIISGAPEAAKAKTSGPPALDYTTGGWIGNVQTQPNPATIAYLQEKVGQAQVYILGGTGTQVATSSNNILYAEFY